MLIDYSDGVGSHKFGVGARRIQVGGARQRDADLGWASVALLVWAYSLALNSCACSLDKRAHRDRQGHTPRERESRVVDWCHVIVIS